MEIFRGNAKTMELPSGMSKVVEKKIFLWGQRRT